MAWNVFRFCTALRGLGSIMILLVLGVVGVTYYAVVITNYGPALYHGGLESLLALLILLFFHVLLVMLLWSYFSVVFTDPGSVPPNWRPTVDEESGDTIPLASSEFVNQVVGSQLSPVVVDPSNSRVRYCRKCNQLKPPRCHHCSFYTFLETTLVTLALLPQFVAFFSDREIPGTPGTLATTFLAFGMILSFSFLVVLSCCSLCLLLTGLLYVVLNLAFASSVLGFLIMHISLVSANTTTIEAYEKKSSPKWRYDLGRRRNFEQKLKES
ncbi:putative protein S-acyltransferase 14 [Nymphaea thermarum]|nr:putative protein S-acyltransferase 14 [Nymphaea thermarum]